MNHRQSVRTTRMLAEAIELARAGRAVYVVGASRSHIRRLEIQAGSEALELGIKFETPSRLRNFDLRTMHLAWAHPKCTVLVDHHAIEAVYGPMLEMLHRYDLPSEELQ